MKITKRELIFFCILFSFFCILNNVHASNSGRITDFVIDVGNWLGAFCFFGGLFCLLYIFFVLLPAGWSDKETNRRVFLLFITGIGLIFISATAGDIAEIVFKKGAQITNSTLINSTTFNHTILNKYDPSSKIIYLYSNLFKTPLGLILYIVLGLSIVFFIVSAVYLFLAGATEQGEKKRDTAIMFALMGVFGVILGGSIMFLGTSIFNLSAQSFFNVTGQTPYFEENEKSTLKDLRLQTNFFLTAIINFCISFSSILFLSLFIFFVFILVMKIINYASVSGIFTGSITRYLFYVFSSFILFVASFEIPKWFLVKNDNTQNPFGFHPTVMGEDTYDTYSFSYITTTPYFLHIRNALSDPISSLFFILIVVSTLISTFLFIYGGFVYFQGMVKSSIVDRDSKRYFYLGLIAAVVALLSASILTNFINVGATVVGTSPGTVGSFINATGTLAFTNQPIERAQPLFDLVNTIKIIIKLVIVFFGIYYVLESIYMFFFDPFRSRILDDDILKTFVIGVSLILLPLLEPHIFSFFVRTFS